MTRGMRVAAVASALPTALALTGLAHATSWVTAVTLDTSPVTELAATVLVALGAIWAIRKTVKLVNKS